MQRRWTWMIAMLLVAVVVVISVPEKAHAAGIVRDCNDYVGVTNRIAGCIRGTLTNVTTRYFTKFYPLVAKAIGGFITLSVVIYGILAAAGMMEKVGRDTFLLVIKLACISYFTTHSDVMYNYTLRAMDASAVAVVKVTPRAGLADGSSDFGNIACLVNLHSAALISGSPVTGPWLALDCLLDTVIGIKVPAKPGDPAPEAGQKWYNDQLDPAKRGMSRGLIYLFFSGMETSVVGVILAVIGFIFMWGLVALIIKCLLVYVAAYIGIGFMMIISPLFIPLVLFRPTKEYFDKWVKATISFAMQPVITLLFVSLTVCAVDLAMFSGDYSLMYRLAGNASRAANFNINEYMVSHGAVKKAPAVLAYLKDTQKIPNLVKDTNDSIVQLSTSDCLQNAAAAGGTTDPACDGNRPIQFYRDSIDWDKLAAARVPGVVLDAGVATPGQQISREVLAAAIFAGIVIFVMGRLMSVVPGMILDLVGDAGQTPNLYGAATGQWSQIAQQKSGAMSQSINDMVSGMVSKRSTP